MACVSGLTNGVYSYIDCCGIPRYGASVGESICLDETYTGSSSGVYIATGQTCTQNCNQGPLGYSFIVSGVCSAATGSVIFSPFGGTPPYTIDNITPGSISAQTSFQPRTRILVYRPALLSRCSLFRLTRHRPRHRRPC